MKGTKQQLAEVTGGPVVEAGMLAAWPPGTGAGSELLTALLEAAKHRRVSALALARDEGLADWYVARHGAFASTRSIPGTSPGRRRRSAGRGDGPRLGGWRHAVRLYPGHSNSLA